MGQAAGDKDSVVKWALCLQHSWIRVSVFFLITPACDSSPLGGNAYKIHDLSRGKYMLPALGLNPKLKGKGPPRRGGVLDKAKREVEWCCANTRLLAPNSYLHPNMVSSGEMGRTGP